MAINSGAGRKTITVVIPTFNRRKRLQNALESVLKETRVPIKIHIFDNASTDDTENYARTAAALDPRISYFRSDYNRGNYNNYVRAFASIETDYYIPLADDDWLLPDFMFDAFRILEEHSDVGAAIFVTEQRNEAGGVECTYPPALDRIKFGLLTPSEHLRDWMTYGHYGWSSILWRSETLKRVGAPYFFVGLPSDVDFQAQIFCDFPVYVVNRPGAVYLSHGEQASRAYGIPHVRNWALLFKRLDRKVHDARIFDRREYIKLKETMQYRYRAVWRRPSTSPLNDKQTISIAALAGFRLGDWDLAFTLLDQLKSNTSARSSLGGQILLLPEGAGVQNETLENSSKSRGGLVPSIKLWLKRSGQTIDLLNGEIDLLTSEVSRLKEQHEKDVQVLNQITHELTSVREHRDSLLRSMSWRVTSPLRYVKRLLRHGR